MFVRILFLLWFFLTLAEAASAGPLIAAIGAVVSGVQAAIAASPIFGMIFKTVIGLGMSLLQQAMNRQKNKPSLVGTTLEIKMGDDQPMTFPVGARAVAGRRKYIGSWGEDGKTPNAYLTDVIEISNLPSYAGPLGMTSLWVGQQKCGVLFDEPHPDGRGYPVQQFIHPNGKRFMWIKYYDGTQTSADPFLMAKFGGHPTRPYTGERIGRGCQYIILTTLIDNDLQLGGTPPDVLVEPHPTPMYDPRKDSTNGGNGNHRYGNWSTYQPTLNPMVIAYNICRGIYYTPNEWVFGGQAIEPVQLPNSAWFAAMNECDRDNGSGVAQYRCGLEIQCDQEPLEVIEALRVACAGRISENGGIIKPLVGAPGAAVYSFDDSGVIVTEDQDFLPFPSLKNTHNGVAGTYPEPNQRWAMTDAPEQRNPDQEAADGGRWLPAPIRFDAVPFTAQVQHLTKTLAAEQRRFRVHMLTLPPSAWALEPNDVVSWTSERNGYVNKKFLITAISGSAGMLQHVTLMEIDPTDFDPPTIYIPAPNGWIGPITVPSQPMTGWAVEPATIKDAGGIDRRPAIKISCGQDLEDITGVWVQVRVKASGDMVFDSDSNPYATPYSWIISGQWTLPNVEYEARGRYLPQSNRPTDWSVWLTVKTPNVLINAVDIFDGAIIQSKIADAAVTAAKIMDEAITNLKLADKAVSTAKIEVAAVTADVLASNAVIASKLADGAVTARALAQGAVDATSLASGLKAVEVVNALPATGNSEGRQVFLTTDGKLYRYHNGAWTAAVAAGDVNGTLNSTQIADNAITNSKLANLAIDASKLADAAITVTKIADGAISTPKLQANAITADKIAARSITARQLVLTDFSNIADNGWQQGTLDGWPFKEPVDAFYQDPNQGDASGWILRSRGRDCAYSNAVACTAGETYYFDAWVFNTDAANANMYGVLYNPDGSFGAWLVVQGTALKNQWVRLKGQLTVPSGYARIGMLLQVDKVPGNGELCYWSKPVMRRASGAELIVDGAVTATKIATGTITADKMAANSVTAGTIAAGAVSAAQIAAGAVTANKLAAGSVSAKALAVGNGGNLLTNTDLSAGLTGWAYEWSNEPASFRLRLRTDTYAPAPGAIEIYQSNGTQNIEYGVGSVDAYGNMQYISVRANAWYELSVYYLGHRCKGVRPYLGVYDGAGNWLAWVAWGDSPAYQNIDPLKSLANYGRFWGKYQMPANAASVRVFFRSMGTVNGQGDSYLWLTHMFFGEANANQTEPTPWSEGGLTLISGGNIVSNAITADKIAANAVTAGRIAVGAVTAGTIAAGAVTAATIAGGSITGDKIAANTIGANQIAAGAITAKSLVLTDFSNMVDNGWQGGNLDGWATQNLQNFYLDTVSGDAAGYVVQSLGRDCCTSKTIAVTAGETYAFDVWVYNADSNTANILVIQYSANGAVTYGFVTQTTVKNSWIRLQGRYTIPTGCVKIAMLLQVDRTAGTGNFCHWSKPVMRRATSGELIVDGAITGNKIAANAITAAQIATNAITTDKLILAGVTIDKIAPGAVTAMNAGRVGDLQVIGSGGTVNLAAVGISVDGDSRVMINAMSLGQYGLNNGSRDAQPIGCNIFRNGLAIFSQTYYLSVVQTIVSTSGGGSSGGAGTTTTQTTYTAGLVGVPALYDAPGPGYHVYTFQLYVPPGNNIGWRETNIVATAFKR